MAPNEIQSETFNRAEHILKIGIRGESRFEKMAQCQNRDKLIGKKERKE